MNRKSPQWQRCKKVLQLCYDLFQRGGVQYPAPSFMRCGGIACFCNKLEKGDEIRVIAPSRILSIVRQDVFEKAEKFLLDKGFTLSFSDPVSMICIKYSETPTLKQY